MWYSNFWYLPISLTWFHESNEFTGVGRILHIPILRQDCDCCKSSKPFGIDYSSLTAPSTESSPRRSGSHSQLKTNRGSSYISGRAPAPVSCCYQSFQTGSSVLDGSRTGRIELVLNFIAWQIPQWECFPNRNKRYRCSVGENRFVNWK